MVERVFDILSISIVAGGNVVSGYGIDADGKSCNLWECVRSGRRDMRIALWAVSTRAAKIIQESRHFSSHESGFVRNRLGSRPRVEG